MKKTILLLAIFLLSCNTTRNTSSDISPDHSAIYSDGDLSKYGIPVIGMSDSGFGGADYSGVLDTWPTKEDAMADTLLSEDAREFVIGIIDLYSSSSPDSTPNEP